jgi:hypothetical protein
MDLQMVIVALVVAACAIYLVRHWLRMLQGKSTGCHTGCAGCPHNTACPSANACQAEAMEKQRSAVR